MRKGTIGDKSFMPPLGVKVREAALVVTSNKREVLDDTDGSYKGYNVCISDQVKFSQPQTDSTKY